MAWLFLAAAIAAEVTGTLALKASEGLSRLGPSVLVVLGYGAAFVLLGVALKAIPVGASYAVWSGSGTVGAAVGGMVLFGERLSWTAVAGIVTVIGGVVAITLSEAGG